VESHRAGIFDRALLYSLTTVQAAKTRSKLLTASSTTQAELLSKIEICDVLLAEIRAIRCNLAYRMNSRGVIRPCSLVARRNRGNRYLPVPQDNPANRSKWKR